MSKVVLKIEASTAGTKGTIRIVDFISMYTETSATRVREIVDDFLDKGTTEHEVYINSRGGSTVEAVEIANELKRLPNVTLKVGAIAASAATYLMTKFKSTAYSNSQFMIHRPKLAVSGDVEQVKADLKALEITTADYKSSYAAKTGKTEDEIEALFVKGDYWMTAKEAKEIKLLDEIIEEPMQITSEDVERLVAAGSPNIPKPNEKLEIEHTMKNRNQIIAALKLPADATDEQIEQAVKDAQAKADQVETLTAAQKAAVKTEGKAFVAKAVLEKKITADVADKWEESYEKNPENTKAMINAMPAVQKPTQEGVSGTEAAGREKWTLEDYQTKDPEALGKMMTENPEKFKQLEADYFGQ